VFMEWLSRALRWAPILSSVLQARASYLLPCSECSFSVSAKENLCLGHALDL
jgi:hypothetical protein